MAIVNPVQVQKFLSGLDYPCSKDEVIEHAKAKGADQQVIDTLKRAPMDEFNSPNDVSEAIGNID